MFRFSILRSLLLGMALAAPVAAQDATGSGVVTEQGRPVAGAPVVVDGGEPILTDQDGRFTAPVDAGEHKFKVALRGYQPVERTVTAEKDKTVAVDFALEPVLQIQSLTVPATLKAGTEGKAQLMVKNAATSAYAVEHAGLTFVGADGKERGADFTVQPDAANPATINAGETATFNFNVTPQATAAAGAVTVRANLFGFDTALGKNLLENGSFETVDQDGNAAPWTFGGDNTDLARDWTGTVVTETALTGRHSVRITVPEIDTGDVRFYWSQNAVPIKPSRKYVLSGYVKTQDVASEEQFGAAVYVPILGNDPYQQPNAPWITGTRDWRKDIIVFETTADGDSPAAYIRGEIQRGTGTAWFDNISLTEGGEDASLTITGGDQKMEVTAA